MLWIGAGICSFWTLSDVTAKSVIDSPMYTQLGVAEVARSCPYLHTIYLRRCLNLTDDAITSIAEHCKYLRHLNLSGCANITDSSLEAIGQNSRLLQSLNLARTKVTWIEEYTCHHVQYHVQYFYGSYIKQDRNYEYTWISHVGQSKGHCTVSYKIPWSKSGKYYCM